MKARFDNQVISSLVLWINHYLCGVGEAFTNHGSYLYPTNQTYGGYYTYSSPFSQFVADYSISGANIPSGIYLNNTFVTPGQSGFVGYNYEKGSAYFSSPVPAGVKVSGNYAVKDFNVVLTNEPEEKIIFEKEIKLKQRFNQSVTGLLNDELTYPVIFVKNVGRNNEPFAFGGHETSILNFSLYIFSDSRFKLDSCIGLLCDSARSLVPLFEQYEMPYDFYGKFNSGVPFNYNAVAAPKNAGSQTAYLSKAQQSRFSQSLFRESRQVNSEAFFDIVDLNLEKIRLPRQ